jgi:1-acyl-sn-glycerol-3-phosphate acyltransferase
LRPRAGETAETQRIAGAPIRSDDWTVRALLMLAGGLATYHRHRVLHLGRLQQVLGRGRRVILVGNHALDIVDPLLLVATIMQRLGVVPRFIAHEKGWFEIPLLREFATRFHVIPSRRPEDAAEALRHDGFLMLYPGAIREAGMRSYWDEPYRLKWAGRTGFLRLALEADAEIVFVAAVGSDEAYYQSRIPLPETLLRRVNGGDGRRYAGMRLRLGAFGAHLVPGIFPLPVRLTHVVAPPLDLGDRVRALHDPAAFARLHEWTWAECQAVLDRAVGARDRYTDVLDRTVRGIARSLHDLGL